MTIQSEIKAVQAATRKRIAAIRARERKLQQKVDLRIVELLREKHPKAASELEATAREQLAAEAARRSSTAKRSTAKAVGVPESVAAPNSHDDGDAHGYGHDSRSGS